MHSLGSRQRGRRNTVVSAHRAAAVDAQALRLFPVGGLLGETELDDGARRSEHHETAASSHSSRCLKRGFLVQLLHGPAVTHLHGGATGRRGLEPAR